MPDLIKWPKRRWALILSVCCLIVFFLLSRPGAWWHQSTWKLPTGNGRPAVAVGFSHGVILATDGSLWTWGETQLGWQVLGLGSNVRTQAVLQRIGRENDWVNVAAGEATTLALKSDGTVWGWGENIYGQLGPISKMREEPLPTRAVPGNDWKQVAVAGPHSVALKRDGSLWSWGNNWGGQLGDGTTNYSKVPIRVGNSTNWTRIWANLIQNVGQQSDGSLWFWGWDYTHSKDGSSVPVPTRISSETNWNDIGMGDYMMFAIRSDGTLWAWGRQAHVFTGSVDPQADTRPEQVGTDHDWLACSEFSQSCPLFLKRDGSIWELDGSDRRGGAVVTGIINGLVTNNHLRCVADSTTLGGDPAFGILKELEIACELGSSNRVFSFGEGKNVDIGTDGQELKVVRALYGDPKWIRDVAKGSLSWATNALVPLRRIDLPTNLVAFVGGRHRSGAALTAGGEVWVWGEALGQHTPALVPLQALSKLLNRIGIPAHWGEPDPVFYKEPVRLGGEANP